MSDTQGAYATSYRDLCASLQKQKQLSFRFGRVAFFHCARKGRSGGHLIWSQFFAVGMCAGAGHDAELPVASLYSILSHVVLPDPPLWVGPIAWAMTIIGHHYYRHHYYRPLLL